uniref:Ribonuclease H-like domain-containing protein n=1 Tax=Tanacetum cinerariifolium TaxID=118510 RepID=A0A6L2MME6_TANCI|nr:ribonuclease H-like domain-containing protein [Tanacetum cinerariifolium]
MIDYALWEVIDNGATLPKTQVVEGVTTEMPITMAKEKDQRRLEDAKKLLEAVEKNKADLDIMSMDDLYNNLNVFELEVKGMSSSSLSTQNMTYVSSTNNNTSSTNGTVNNAQAVNTTHGVSTASTKADEGPNFTLMAFSSSSSNSKIVDNYKKGLGYENYNAVPPPYKGNFMPPIPDLSFTSLDELVNKPVVENCKAKSSEEETKGNPQMDLQDQEVIDNGCSRHMTGNMSYLTDDKEIDWGYVDFGGNPKGGKITGKSTKDETSGILKSFITGIENLVDHKAEAVNIACYVQNRVLVVKPYIKTPYEHFHGRIPTLSFMRPFGCSVTILNTIDHLGKFNGKADKGFFVEYSLNSKSFRVFNSRTRIVEENLHIRFSESTPNVIGSRPYWLFDIDALTRIMNYEPIVACTQSNGFADPKSSHNDGSKPSSDDGKKVDEDPRKESECKDQENEDNVNSTNNVNTIGNVNIISSSVNVAATNEVNVVGEKISIKLVFDPKMPALKEDSLFDFSSYDEDDGAVADMNNLDTTIQVSPILTTRIHKDHPLDQVIGDLQSATQIRKMSKNLEEHGFASTIQQRINNKDLQNCLFACFLSQEEPKNAILAYALFKDFVVYQMDVKSVILYGKIKEELYQLNPKVLHLHAMKRIFRYLKGQPKLRLWYPKDSPFDLVAYTDSDYARASLDRKSTTKETKHIEIRHHFIRDCKEKKLIQMVKIYTDKNVADLLTKAFNFWSTAMVKTINGKAQLHAKVDGKKIIITESFVRRVLRLADEEGSAIPTDPQHILTIIQQLSSQPKNTQKPRKPTRKDTHVPQPSGPTQFVTDEAVYKELGDGPRCQETMGDTIAQTRRVKKLEKRNRSRTHGPKRLYKVGLSTRVESSGDEESLGKDASKQERRINAIDADEDITLVIVADNEMFDIDVLGGEEVFVAGQNENVVEEDNGKGIMIEEPVKFKKKDQIRLDEEVAKKLQAEFDEEERLAREKDEKEERANIALIEEWDDI